jgi:thiol:disulfide interchange protein DsbD
MSFTPCVLPMLPILSSLIVGARGVVSRGRGLTLAACYSLGMALVYTGLGVLAGLAGEGFAAALQTPWAIAAFALLLTLLALSMFDVYELQLPAALSTRLADQSNRLPGGQAAGVFAMGGISALMVSPCVSAPLAGALLFISQSRDWALGGAALFAMAAGMSVPLLLLGASAGRWLPRAGLWMSGVKRVFGVLMLAVAIWLAQPVLPQAAALALWGLLLLCSAWLLWPARGAPARTVASRRVLAVLVLGAALAQLVGAATGGKDPLQPLAHLGAPRAAQGEAPAFTVLRSEAEFDAALQAAGGRPVVLDFYADWCVSCKEMERFTFSDADIAARLRQAVLLKADVTANTDSQRALLRRFKLFGPPGTLFFDRQGRELPQARVVGFQSAQRFGQTLTRAGL